jgi:hypothetical protein
MITGLVWVLMLAGSALAQGGELVGAEWGVQGRRGVDVTARLRTFIQEGVLQLEATRFNLGIDPAPHENKVLVIHLRQRDGEVKDYSYPERSVVRLELHHEEWHGRREDQDRRDEDQDRHDEHQDRHDEDQDRHDHDAHHGDYERRDHDGRRAEGSEPHERGLQILRASYGADGQFVNVTDALRSRVDEGRLFLRVDNYSMGIDPLPGAHKFLRVLYTMDGQRRNIVVDEKTDLRLP